MRIYKITFDKAIVIVSGLPNHPSRSILGEELTLIPLVCNNFALKPTKTMWLEHYPKGYIKDEEIYEQVIFIADNIHSKSITKEYIEALLSVKL